MHAQHSCARSGPGNLGARDPGFPGPGNAQECCACTRDLLCCKRCMKKAYEKVYEKAFEKVYEKAFAKGV